MNMVKHLSVYCVNTKKEYQIEGGSTLLDILSQIPDNIGFVPIGAIVNNKLEGLSFPIYMPKTIEFLSVKSAAGMRIYIRSLCMLLFKAIKELYPQLTLRIEHSISKGYYCRILKGEETWIVDNNFIESIKNHIKTDVENNLKFTPQDVLKDTAIEVFKTENLMAKVKLFETRHMLYTTVYTLGDITDSYYGPLAPSSGYIKVFDLIKYKEGTLLLGPDAQNPGEVQTPIFQEKMFEAFTEYQRFNRIIGVRNIGQLNEAVINGESSDLINVAEALHANKISAIANEIARRHKEGGARIVLVAGPSSSGKTTTAQRLAIYLLTNFLRPVTVSLDNYFINRENTPVDEDGEKDFEHINALDLELFNSHLNILLNGGEVELPYYNFERGEREYRGDKIRLGVNDVLLIEGIHGLNPELTKDIDEKMKFRVYVSALTTLSIDDHNWIPTTDNRLLRRIIRDYKYRGISAKETIKRWPSVRRGEEKWIFPYQENADAMFNSSLLFELAVMKDFGEKILSDVANDCVEHAEANRLLKFLRYFEPITEKLLPPTSLLREFLGGSSLKY